MKAVCWIGKNIELHNMPTKPVILPGLPPKISKACQNPNSAAVAKGRLQSAPLQRGSTPPLTLPPADSFVWFIGCNLRLPRQTAEVALNRKSRGFCHYQETFSRRML